MNHRLLGSPARPARAALTLLAATQFLLVLDSAIVNVALPSMQADLGFTTRGITWVVNAYALLFGGLLLLGGRLADVVGARRVFLSGVSLFAAASVAGALAPTAGALVTARGLQGIGAAMTAPAAMALVMVTFPAGPARNRALGALGAAAGLGGASGAVVGGLLTEAWGWPAILWINVPIGVLIVTGAIRCLPVAAPPASRSSLDLGGAVTATAAVVALVYGLIGASGTGSPAGYAVLPVLAAAMLVALLVRIERRTADPLLPPSLFDVPGLRGANVTVLFSAMAMMPMWFLLTVYLQAVRGYGPVSAGVGVVPTVVMLVTFNGLAHRVIARVGLRAPLVIGLFVAAVGLAWTSDLGPQASFVGDLLWPQLLTGLGFGLAFVAGTVAATSQVPVERSGVAAGLYNTSQQVGGAVGLAVLAAVTAGTGAGDVTALTAHLSLAFRVAAGFAALAAATAWISALLEDLGPADPLPELGRHLVHLGDLAGPEPHRDAVGGPAPLDGEHPAGASPGLLQRDPDEGRVGKELGRRPAPALPGTRLDVDTVRRKTDGGGPECHDLMIGRRVGPGPASVTNHPKWSRWASHGGHDGS